MERREFISMVCATVPAMLSLWAKPKTPPRGYYTISCGTLYGVPPALKILPDGVSGESRKEIIEWIDRADIPGDFTLTLDEETKEFVFDFGRDSRSAETASRNKNVSGVVDSGIRVEGEGSASSR